MPVNSARIREALKQFDFQALLVEELGWDRHRMQPLSLLVDGSSFVLNALAEKRGMVVFLCEPDKDGEVPPYAIRRKIENQVRRAAHEHLVIYIDREKKNQVWQWVRREPGRPSACREHQYHAGQSGDALIQKLEGISFSLDEEDALTITTVAGRARQAFDVDRVTKRFYDRFKAEHAAFLTFINGIQSQGDREWYVSLMLNRLMFVYFIQKKRFLDGDANYLRNRLRMMQERKGKDQFLSFYRHFLLRLFHEGLGQQKHSSELDALVGKVPYLNGGLFDVHQLERENPTIEIPDEAFEKIFDFFDAYQWHLDERPLRADNEINPDVLGYIFEKYINQKQMGAYYTKEDITEYIAKSSVIPSLFRAAEKECPIAFQPDSALWRLVKDDPDRYFYSFARQGCDLALPEDIAAGLNEPSRRASWNRLADPGYALPTETWREHVNRRRRYEKGRALLVSGDITSIEDLITHHLDLRQFAQDAIENCEGPELLRAFYQSIERVSILDPACGSGAFLFAALTILEPLYEACLDRMRVFLEERPEMRGKERVEKFSDFRKILDRVGKHPNLRYFILKSIVIGNLFGVDIMEEAVEICKLRLFLKLVAQVDRVEDIEPLPDIDFNIRAGNSLVGFATYEEVADSIGATFDFENSLQRIDESAEIADRAFRAFREMQTEHGMDSSDFAAAKVELRKRLDRVAVELNQYLAAEYGVDPSKIERFDTWKSNAQPFHWFVEFYGIVKSGGFDVIIGNPPYVAYSKVVNLYRIKNYETEPCGNLYAFFMERSLRLSKKNGWFGMIVPVSSVSSATYQPLVKLFLERRIWLSSYSNRPAKLFQGVEQRLTIFVVRNVLAAEVFTSPYQHWYETERERLFMTLSFYKASIWEHSGMPIKSGSVEAESVFTRLTRQKAPLLMLKTRGEHGVWFHDGPTYWVRALPFEPNAGVKSERSTHYHRIPLNDEAVASQLASVMSSSLFYFYFKMVSNCRDLGQKEWSTFPLGAPEPRTLAILTELGELLEKRLCSTAGKRTRQYPSGTVEYEEYYPAKAKAILDDIDRALGNHYGLTPEELDFIINYDIKYRLGPDAGEDE